MTTTTATALTAVELDDLLLDYFESIGPDRVFNLLFDHLDDVSWQIFADHFQYADDYSQV